MATADSQFEFLRDEWPMLFEPAAQAESLVYPDSRSSCFHARRALELAVHWLYANMWLEETVQKNRGLA